MKDKRIWIIFLIVFVNVLGFGIILPILPYFAETMGASALTIGLLSAAYSLCQLFASPILGELSDKYGRRPILLFSIAGTALSFLLLGVAKTLPILFLSRIIDGLSGGNISTAQAYIADITSKEERSASLGMLGAAFGLGFILGPALGGALSVFGYSVPAYVAMVVSLIATVLAWFYLPESVDISVTKEFKISKKLFSIQDLLDALSHKQVGNFVIVILLTNIAFTIMQGTFSLFAEHVLGLSASRIGYLFAYIGVLNVLIQMVFVKQILKYFSEKKVMLASVILLAISLLWMGCSMTVPMLMIALTVMCFGQSLLNPLVTGGISKAVPDDEQGSIMGITQSVASVGRLIGPVLGTFLFGAINQSVPFVVASLVTITSIIFLLPKKYLFQE